VALGPGPSARSPSHKHHSPSAANTGIEIGRIAWRLNMSCQNEVATSSPPAKPQTGPSARRYQSAQATAAAMPHSAAAARAPTTSQPSSVPVHFMT
jgi:hypothetical protein